MPGVPGTAHAPVTAASSPPAEGDEDEAATARGHVLAARRAGVLCDVAALPAGFPPRRLLDFLARAGLSLWQTLPLNPRDLHGSPYASASLLAGEPRLLEGHGGEAELLTDPAFAPVARAYADFTVARAHHGAPWTAWPTALRDGEPEALERLRGRDPGLWRSLHDGQMAFDARWRGVLAEAGARGILLFGDTPLYPAHDSVDVWCHPDLFELDGRGHPASVAGVPPDYFSETGQRWGNPVYAWSRHLAGDFAWWRQRIDGQLRWFDILRIDHFRGLEACWVIPDDAPPTAGHWSPVPGDALLERLSAAARGALVAEDLGFITEEVVALRDRWGLPGMRVLQFAFDGSPDNPHLPEHCPEHAVLYTGTHDNDTSLGWLRGLDEPTRARVLARTGGGDDWPWPLLELALASPAETVVIPIQDFLGLGSEARTNVPGTTAPENWHWKLPADALTDALAARIRARVEAHGRQPEA